MNIIHRGKVLTQQQIDAIVPVLNEAMVSELSGDEFKRRVDEALEDAGITMEEERK